MTQQLDQYWKNFWPLDLQRNVARQQAARAQNFLERHAVIGRYALHVARMNLQQQYPARLALRIDEIVERVQRTHQPIEKDQFLVVTRQGEDLRSTHPLQPRAMLVVFAAKRSDTPRDRQPGRSHLRRSARTPIRDAARRSARGTRPASDTNGVAIRNARDGSGSLGIQITDKFGQRHDATPRAMDE